jgi:putative copper export protein
VSAVTGPLTGWLLFAALVTALGGLAGRFLIAPRLGPQPDPVGRWLGEASGGLAVAGGFLLPLAMGLVFYRQLAEFRDPFVPWTEDAELLLSGTAWGTTWTYAAAGAVVAAVGLALGTVGARSGWLLGGAAVMALSAFPALTGHASASGPLRPLTLTADTLHVLAAGGWIGSLAFVLTAERGWRRRRREGGPESLLPLLVPAFSPVAMACVATLVLTGLTASWIHLPGPGALVSSRYGRLLSLKLVLVAGVAGLGWVSWRKLTPRLGETSRRDALRGAATIELMVAHRVRLVTAMLVVTPPPEG